MQKAVRRWRKVLEARAIKPLEYLFPSGSRNWAKGGVWADLSEQQPTHYWLLKRELLLFLISFAPNHPWLWRLSKPQLPSFIRNFLDLMECLLLLSFFFLFKNGSFSILSANYLMKCLKGFDKMAVFPSCLQSIWWNVWKGWWCLERLQLGCLLIVSLFKRRSFVKLLPNNGSFSISSAKCLI